MVEGDRYKIIFLVWYKPIAIPWDNDIYWYLTLILFVIDMVGVYEQHDDDIY